MPNKVTTQVWFSQGMSYVWPEQLAGVTPNIGVCFPGGGTRALSAAMGQLRALISIGFMPHVDYISCVSGGSWASTAFAYYRDGATSDEQFLGTYTEPRKLTPDLLDQMDHNCLGWGATLDLGDAIDVAFKEGFKEDMIWAAAIGHVFFSRFGLWDSKNLAYFSLDDATVAQIKAANPSLADATFYTVRQPDGYKMPYLLINGTLDGPTAGAPYSNDPLVMVTFSPLYCGIPFRQTIHYVNKHLEPLGSQIDAVVGGGFIQPFAWGSTAPAAPAQNGSVEAGAPAAPFGVAQASGVSSSAFAAAFEKIKLVDGLLPEELYWPPVPGGEQPAAQTFEFGDGGNLENYGLIPLLMRGIKKVVLFINSEVKLNTKYDPSTLTVSSLDVDLSLSYLFGIPVSKGALPAYANNQVFPQADFVTVFNGLKKQKLAGNAAVFRTTHTTVRNDWWGLPGGTTVEILYVYLDQVTDWMNQIGSGWIKDQLRLGDLGEFRHFPNYKTIDENIDPPWSLTELSARQVNLLANLTSWVVLNNKAEFEALLS